MLLKDFLTIRPRRFRGVNGQRSAITVDTGLRIIGNADWHREVWAAIQLDRQPPQPDLSGPWTEPSRPRALWIGANKMPVEVEIIEALPGEEKIVVWPVGTGYTKTVWAHQVVFDAA